MPPIVPFAGQSIVKRSPFWPRRALAFVSQPLASAAPAGVGASAAATITETSSTRHASRSIHLPIGIRELGLQHHLHALVLLVLEGLEPLRGLVQPEAEETEELGEPALGW